MIRIFRAPSVGLGAGGDPIRVKRPVSEGREALPKPFKNREGPNWGPWLESALRCGGGDGTGIEPSPQAKLLILYTQMRGKRISAGAIPAPHRAAHITHRAPSRLRSSRRPPRSLRRAFPPAPGTAHERRCAGGRATDGSHLKTNDEWAVAPQYLRLETRARAPTIQPSGCPPWRPDRPRRLRAVGASWGQHAKRFFGRSLICFPRQLTCGFESATGGIVWD